MNHPDKIIIGTRGSPLALAQANEVKRRLLAAHPSLAPEQLEILPIITSGDRNMQATLYDAGGKGLFTKELEEALYSGTIHFAVHSMKDMTSSVPVGLVIETILPREDARDALVGGGVKQLADLPHGASIGTSSPRRGAQVLIMRPDIKIVPLRGNVATRMQKIAAGAADATLLAMAGLNRLALAEHGSPIPTSTMLPAVAQGAIGIECRQEDTAIRTLLAAINHAESATCVSAERALLARLEGSCRTPIAAHAQLTDGQLHLRALIATTDGTRSCTTSRTGAAQDAERMGLSAAEELLINGKGILS